MYALYKKELSHPTFEKLRSSLRANKVRFIDLGNPDWISKMSLTLKDLGMTPHEVDDTAKSRSFTKCFRS